jgi:hypothetical protein
VGWAVSSAQGCQPSRASYRPTQPSTQVRTYVQQLMCWNIGDHCDSASAEVDVPSAKLSEFVVLVHAYNCRSCALLKRVEHGQVV